MLQFKETYIVHLELSVVDLSAYTRLLLHEALAVGIVQTRNTNICYYKQISQNLQNS